MSEREQLERAIATLEAQRGTLGDEVVDAALAPMREKLAALEEGKPTTRPAVAGERRVVTVLFCDVTGSTAMAEQLDPEVWAGIMNTAFEALSEPIDRFGGTLARLMGDAILAFFGAPTAHEDDPQRAVSAGLAIIEAIQPLRQKLRRERNMDFNVRVGINTGLTVVGDVGSRVFEEYTAMGDAVNLAARMEQTAKPGTVQIAEGTYKLVSAYFDVEPIGGVIVKGKREPVSAYRVLREAVMPGPARGLEAHGIHSPLVGREAELAAAKEAVARLAGGGGGILLIYGEAGIGKSRLLAELFQVAVEVDGDPPHQEVLWLEGHAQSFGQTISFWPMLEILRMFAGFVEEDNDKEAWRKLETAVGELFPEGMADILPYLAFALNLEIPEDYAERVKYLDGQAMGDQIALAFQDLFQALSARRPLVLVFEDLHWVDDSTARLLERLLPLVKTSPLLICGLSRPVSESPALRLGELAAADYEPYYTEVRLNPLSKVDSNRLVNNLLEIDDLPPSMHEIIVRKADGNPFFLEEVIRNLIEVGVVVHNPSTGHWRATSRVTAIAIPDTIQGVIMARVDRLDEAVKGVLRAAAVIGRIFLYRILNQVLKGDEGLDRHLADLASVELIREKERLPELEYIFKHALARDATYESILLQKRRELHARVGQAIETTYSGRLEEFYGLLAYHYTSAGDWGKAQHYLFRVGDQAQGKAADSEALVHYQQAIAAYEEAFGEPMASQQRGSVERKMGEAYFRLTRFDDAWEFWSSAAALLDRAIPEKRLEAAVALVGQMARQILHRLWPQRFVRRVPDDKKLAAREALLAYVRLGLLAYIKDASVPVMLYIGLRSLNLAEMVGYPEDMVRGYAGVAMGAGSAGSLKLSDYYMGLAREADRKHDDLSAHALFLNYWGGNRMGGCRWEEAYDAFVAAADIYQRIGIESEWAGVSQNRAFILQNSGRLDRVGEIHNEVLASAEKRGDRQMIIWLLFNKVEDSLRLGKPGHVEKMFNLLDRVQKMLAEDPNVHDEILVQSLMAQAHYRRGDLAASRQATETAMRRIRSERLQLHPYMADAQAGLPFMALSLWEKEGAGQALAADALSFYRGQARASTAYLLPRASLYQGIYDWLSGKHRRARKAWAKGLALAEQFEMPYDQGLAHYEIGRHRPAGDPDRERHLQRAAEIFTHLDAAWHLAQVTEALVP